VAVAALAVAALAGGCGQGAGGDDGTAGPSAAASPSRNPDSDLLYSVRDLDNPAKEFELNDVAYQIMADSRYVYLRDCFAKRDMEFTQPPPADIRQAGMVPWVEDVASYWGVLTQIDATVYGYHGSTNDYSALSPADTPAQDGEPVVAPAAWPRPAADPEDPAGDEGAAEQDAEAADAAEQECSDAWDAVVDEGLNPDSEVIAAWSYAAPATASVALEDPEVTNALELWAACMARGGYTYQTPLEAMKEFVVDPVADPAASQGPVAPSEAEASAGPTEAPSMDVEVAAAQSDIICKKESDLLPVWVKAVHREMTEWVAQNPATMEAIEAYETGRAQKAKQILDQLR
jgi:hypothetical protein